MIIANERLIFLYKLSFSLSHGKSKYLYRKKHVLLQLPLYFFRVHKEIEVQRGSKDHKEVRYILFLLNKLNENDRNFAGKYYYTLSIALHIFENKFFRWKISSNIHLIQWTVLMNGKLYLGIGWTDWNTRRNWTTWIYCKCFITIYLSKSARIKEIIYLVWPQNFPKKLTFLTPWYVHVR